MNSEEAKKIKCDRCGAICGLHRHETGWRCGLCVWNERANLITWAKQLFNSVSYRTTSNPKKVAIVSLSRLESLEELVRDVTS